jgi:hypothetical protein
MSLRPTSLDARSLVRFHRLLRSDRRSFVKEHNLYRYFRYGIVIFGGKGTRTPDPRLAKPML